MSTAGLRRAPDVMKALALGAKATLIGRPSLWAVATGGADGVAQLLGWYESELRRTMHLCGAATVDDIDRSLVRRAGLGPVVTTVAAMLAARAADDRTGVMDGDGRWTWREAVLEGAARGALARSLIGTDKPHVGVLLPNGAEYLFWLNGAALAGAAIVGINPTRRGGALAADVRATDCAMIVTDAEGAALLDGLDLGVDEDKVLVIGTEKYDALLQRFAGGDETRGLIEHVDAVDESALYLLIFTSGTTGVPKAVRCTQGRLAGIAEVAGPGYGYTPDDVCYCPMPLFHGNTLMALWGPTVLMGAAIAVRPRFSASAFLDDVRRYGATKFSYVGKAIAYILATPERPDDADNTLKSAFGTEASVRDRDRFRARFGCYLIEGYGQSEGGAAINPVLGMPKGALGKPVDGVDLTVISPETGEECPRPSSTGTDGCSMRVRPSASWSTAAAAAASRAITGARTPSRRGCAAAGTGRATWDTSTPTGSSTSPAAPGTGCASTRRTSPPARSRPSSRAIPTWPSRPSTPCPTRPRVRATRSWSHSRWCRGRLSTPRPSPTGSRPSPTSVPSGYLATSASRPRSPRRPRGR